MRVELNQAICQGHARCAAVASEVFELDDLGYVATRDQEIPAALEDAARKGAVACPERVISVHE